MLPIMLPMFNSLGTMGIWDSPPTVGTGVLLVEVESGFMSWCLEHRIFQPSPLLCSLWCSQPYTGLSIFWNHEPSAKGFCQTIFCSDENNFSPYIFYVESIFSNNTTFYLLLSSDMSSPTTIPLRITNVVNALGRYL